MPAAATVRARIRNGIRAVAPAVLIMLVAVPAALTSSEAQAQDDPARVQPVRIVVLVDQSASLTPEDVARERDAVRVIVQGEPAADSTVTVLGFGSANAPGQSAVDVVCDQIQLSTPPARQRAADCVGGIRGRTTAEGADTDHLAALQQALERLRGGDPAQPKIVYLLTDGVLDVANSPEAYGPDPAARNDVARQRIPALLAELSRAGVQVWPLGFGAVDEPQLAGFAAGAAQEGCGERTPRPRATVIATSADLLRAVGEASGAARCASVGDPVPGTLPPGSSTDLAVEVPAIASEGSILVFKRDPRVTVTYIDPNGVPVPASGERDGSVFQLSGQGAETEAMRIVNPVPGVWTVRLTSPPDAPDLDVGAVVVFQGALRTSVNVAPICPVPGSDATVSVQVSTARGPIVDPALLQDLAFIGGLRGAGFAPVPPVDLTDDDGDGRYTGTIGVPASAAGGLTFTGQVSGVGVSSVEQPYDAQSNCPPVFGSLNFDTSSPEVEPGDTVSGTAIIENTTTEPRTLQFTVDPPSTPLTVEPTEITAMPGPENSIPFTVRVDPNAEIGSALQARLRLVDDLAGGAAAAETSLSRTVVEPPGFLGSYGWHLLAAALVLVMGGVLFRAFLDPRKDDTNVRGVSVGLYRNRTPLGSDITARFTAKKIDVGVIRDESGAGPQLTTGADGERYTVTRSSSGPVVRGPAGQGEPGNPLDLGGGLQLVVRDRTESARSAPRPPRGATTRTPPRPKYTAGTQTNPYPTD